MLTEDVQYLVNVATFLRTGVEFTVRVGSCPTLAETVVAFGIDLLRTRDLSQITFAVMDILSTFQYDGTKT